MTTTVDARGREEFQSAVLAWYDQHRRRLPWRDSDDAYAVLVSEIMLQQTQVSRVVPKYGQFMGRYPDACSLAAASVGEVIRTWQGLGYNRRAINLHRAACVIVEEHGGRVPDDLRALRALPGIGDYTARAVLAFAYSRPVAPVDTNVARVLARAAAGTPLRGAAVQSVADSLVPADRARDWSAALMDLGASHCTARPQCTDCPVRGSCAWMGRRGDDPAASKAGAPEPFVGSNRYHRGRLLDALRSSPVTTGELGAAAAVDDAATACRIADALVRDGLAVWDGAALRLPG